tara:strand:- start:746 stop:928 length:183 start_codon:yes stop_codon:yes gene_type:complete
MKKLADEATKYLNDKIEDKSEVTEQDIKMAALVCRVQELECEVKELEEGLKFTRTYLLGK